MNTAYIEILFFQTTRSIKMHN